MLIETIEVLVVAGLYTNCYIVADEQSRQGIVIDPGGSPKAILKRIEKLGLDIVLVVNTHGHFDHIGANEEIMEATRAPLAAHAEAVPLYRVQGGAAFFGLRMPDTPLPSRLLRDGDEIRFGQESLVVLHTPGHTPGCISLWSEKHRVLFDGDVLFNAGIGRTDLPGGNYRQLMRSIYDKILTLPEDTRVYPGHGPSTTVGQERCNNPFLGPRPEWI